MDMRSTRKLSAALQGFQALLRRCAQRISAFLKRNGGRIAYYALVAVALCAIARAAEVYRADNAPEDALVLPAVDALDVLETEEEPAPQVLRPEDWRLLRGFSDAPQWRSELGMWEAHPAVDYACERVLCLQAGIVRTVGESGVYGGFVEVESDGVLMRYASVAPAEDIEPGAALEMGDLIGTADASMPGEADAGAHLHLELYLDGSAADFAQYAAVD